MAKRVPRPRSTAYPSDVSDEEWALVAPYLTLSRLDSAQRSHDLRAVFNAIRWLVRTGASWRMMPHDLPPWAAVYQQWQRWVRAGCFEALVHDLRVMLRVQAGRPAQPTAMILDSRTLQSTPESGARAGYDGAKRRKGAKVHAAVDTLGHLLALHVTPADAQDRAQVGALAAAVQDLTGQHVVLGYVDQVYAGPIPRRPAPPTGSSWKSSNTPRRSGALSCCRGAGWWNAPSRGRRASDGSTATTSASRRRWPPITTSPSPASCSRTRWREFRNRLWEWSGSSPPLAWTAPPLGTAVSTVGPILVYVLVGFPRSSAPRISAASTVARTRCRRPDGPEARRVPGRTDWNSTHGDDEAG